MIIIKKINNVPRNIVFKVVTNMIINKRVKNIVIKNKSKMESFTKIFWN